MPTYTVHRLLSGGERRHLTTLTAPDPGTAVRTACAMFGTRALVAECVDDMHASPWREDVRTYPDAPRWLLWYRRNGLHHDTEDVVLGTVAAPTKGDAVRVAHALRPILGFTLSRVQSLASAQAVA